MPCKRIVLTAGEPAGIGPDLCIQLAQKEQKDEIIIIADPDLLTQRANELGVTVDVQEVDLQQAAKPVPKGVLRYLPVKLRKPVKAGVLNISNAQYVLDCLTKAMQLCLDGKCAALVTGPVHKGIINDAGIAFSGHTEFFAEGSGVEKVVMMLATETLRVALVTTHLPLKDVSSAITQTTLAQVITILEHDLKTKFAIASPKIAVCGLNPHAGEGGHLGLEEIEVITPVIDQFKAKGALLSGPWPADTVFVKDNLKNFDAVLAMYHDQGLPVLKHTGFSNAVNVTLGLPFIRTSVDHGTALELAGTGRAKVGSLEAAIKMAVQTAN